MDVLFLCTGNICRSPMAEGMLRARLDGAGVPGRVSSAGLLYEGHPASTNAIDVLAARGIDLSGHRSRVLHPEHLRDADLVLAMARKHAREAVLLDKSVLTRVFTLRDFVRRGTDLPPLEGQATPAWLTELTADRGALGLMGDAAGDEIADPIGRPVRAYEQTADELEWLLDRVVALVPEFAAAALDVSGGGA